MTDRENPRTLGNQAMVPTRDQIELMAYHRWLRRDRAHGFDRVDWLAAEKEVTFQLNYETLIEFSLASPTQLTIGGDDRLSRCRFCERTSRHTEFSRPRPVVQLPVETPLYSAQICDECDADCREPLASACDRLWRGLQSGDTSLKNLSRSPGSMAIFKSLVHVRLVDHARVRDLAISPIRWNGPSIPMPSRIAICSPVPFARSMRPTSYENNPRSASRAVRTTMLHFHIWFSFSRGAASLCKLPSP